MQRDEQLEKRLAEKIQTPSGVFETVVIRDDNLRYLLARSQHAALLETALEACGRFRTRRKVVDGWDQSVTELCWCACQSDRCVNEPRCNAARAILKDRRQDQGGRADNYKHQGPPHIKGA